MGTHVSLISHCRHCPLRVDEQCAADIPKFRTVPRVTRGGDAGQHPPPEWCPLRKSKQHIEVKLAKESKG